MTLADFVTSPVSTEAAKVPACLCVTDKGRDGLVSSETRELAAPTQHE